MGKLIRLELFNFKSYKGHHTLLFGDSYFTSIIGPNGSGKSNSMDAISFVLGIKSSHLRSTHLKDLVYRGRVLKTATINEDGSATMNEAENAETNGAHERNDPRSAWVMAVYEDDDGEEIQWKRTITNQGTSEYRINNTVVTAQRYNDALEEENILIKARNFLVFQGDVEAIASQSPKDLTRLIEQISGSLEYKAEYEKLKEEMETANEKQAFQFNRRRGVNAEIKQYQEQKKEADNYANKVDERDQAIVTHILWKLYQFQRVIEESEAEILKHQEELKEHKRGGAKFEASLEAAKKSQAKASRDVSKVERSIKAKEKDIEVKENSLIPITEKIHLTRERQDKTRSRVQTIAKERDSKNELIKKLQKDLKVIEKAESQWESEWSKVAQQEGRELSEADRHEYNKLREASSKQSADDQIKLDTLSRQVRSEQETLNSLQNQLDNLEQSKSQISSQNETFEKTKAELTETVANTQKDIAAKKKAYNSLISERTRVDQLRNELDEKLADVGKKIIEAEDGRRQSEKERRLRTTVADMKRIYPAVRGRYSELCKPKQKKFGEAMSVVLGRHMDSIIVDDEKTARDCIQYLKDQNLGQATFIPLDTIQTKQVNAGLKSIAKGTRLALDTIDFDSSLERAMLYACGNALVCDDESTAKHICYEKNVDAKVVTLEGVVFHKGGLITGGRGKDQQSRRWEDTDVDGLRKVAYKLQDDLAALPNPKRKAGEEEALQTDLSGLESRLEFAREELKALERNLAGKKTELTHANSELKKLKPQHDAKSKEFAALNKKFETVQKAVSSVEDNIFRDFCKRLGYNDIRAYEAAQGSLDATAAQKRLEFKQQKSRLEQRLKLETQQLNETKSRIDNLEEQIKKDASLISSLEQEKQTISNESDVLMAEIETIREELANLNKELEKHNDNVTEERRKLQKRNKNIEGTLKEVGAKEAEMQAAGSERYALLRKCKLDGITIPLEDDSNGLDKLPIEGIQLGVVDNNEDTMDLDSQDVSTSQRQMPQIDTYGIIVNFDELDDEVKEETDPKYEETLTSKITALNEALSHLAPNMQATNRLDSVQSRLANTEAEFEAARLDAKQSRDAFNRVAGKRTGLFNKAFVHITERIGPIYAELTSSPSLPLGGQAYLDLEDSDEPFLSGLKYHAMPPLKRFRDMEHLSGGEKTIAALALLFAIHSFQPSPFFVLDEVDAALDNANVGRIAGYIEKHRGPGMQFIVISLKSGLFERSESLVGVHRDQTANSSRVLTLDLRKYA